MNGDRNIPDIYSSIIEFFFFCQNNSTLNPSNCSFNIECCINVMCFVLYIEHIVFINLRNAVDVLDISCLF